jgi:hypothetical protein
MGSLPTYESCPLSHNVGPTADSALVLEFPGPLETAEIDQPLSVGAGLFGDETRRRKYAEDVDDRDTDDEDTDIEMENKPTRQNERDKLGVSHPTVRPHIEQYILSIPEKTSPARHS